MKSDHKDDIVLLENKHALVLKMKEDEITQLKNQLSAEKIISADLEANLSQEKTISADLEENLKTEETKSDNLAE